MNTVAVISEYNPFHKGHKYQLDEIKRIFPDAVTISIMSPNFVQRGCPAVFDKYVRGECAVKGGADLALSMPQVHALLSAEGFAEGGIRLANELGATHIAFGVELLDKDLLINIAKILIDPDFDKLIQKELASAPSLSYPVIRERALKKAIGEDASAFIKTPNNILAVEYVKAIIRFAPHIEILPIKRIGNAHLDLSSHGMILSATAIRQLMKENKEFLDKLPEEIRPTVISANKFDFERYEELLCSVVFSKKREDILRCSGSVELTDIIYKNVQKYPDFNSFRNSLSRRKHTETKIDRVLTNILLDIVFDEYLHKKPKYTTLLAMNSKGKEIISSLRKSAEIVFISRGADGKKYAPEGIEVEILADIVYGRCMKTPNNGGHFLKKKPYICEE